MASRGSVRQPRGATQRRLRQLPSVDDLLQDARLRRLAEEVSRPTVVEMVRQVLAGVRAAVRRGLSEAEFAALLAHLPPEVDAGEGAQVGPPLPPGINATGAG